MAWLKICAASAIYGCWEGFLPNIFLNDGSEGIRCPNQTGNLEQMWPFPWDKRTLYSIYSLRLLLRMLDHMVQCLKQLAFGKD